MLVPAGGVLFLLRGEGEEKHKVRHVHVVSRQVRQELQEPLGHDRWEACRRQNTEGVRRHHTADARKGMRMHHTPKQEGSEKASHCRVNKGSERFSESAEWIMSQILQYLGAYANDTERGEWNHS